MANDDKPSQYPSFHLLEHSLYTNVSLLSEQQYTPQFTVTATVFLS